MKRNVQLLLITLLTTVSCHSLVFEDRTDCPSFLFFDIQNASMFKDYEEINANVYANPKQNLIGSELVSVAAVQNKDFYFTVRSTPAVIGYGLIGSRNLASKDSEWTAPFGQNYAPLFRFGFLADVEEESFIVPVEFTKEYTKLSIQFIGYETFVQAEGEFPFDITIRGNTCGIDALTGLPIAGPFEYNPSEQGGGYFEVMLPRQANSNLKLELYGKEGLIDQSGHNRTMNLYSILTKEAGITWKEKNLPDISIRIDYQQWRVEVGVTPWGDQEIVYEF